MDVENNSSNDNLKNNKIIPTKGNVSKKIIEEESNNNNSTLDPELVTPLTSLEGIELISGASAAISKLPENLTDFPKDLLIETLNYKELNFIINALGIKLFRNRTKLEMITAIISRVGNLWGEIRNLALTKKITSSNSLKQLKPKINTKNSLNMNNHLLQPRSPFDPRLSDLLSDMYMSPSSNWNDILLTYTAEESKLYLSTFQSIRPIEEIPKVGITIRDNFLLQYITGPIKVTNDYIQKFQNEIQVFQKMSSILDNNRNKNNL